MLDTLESVERKYIELSDELGKPDVISDRKRFQELAKAHSEMQPIVEKYSEYKKIREELAGAKEIVSTEKEDSELREMAKLEVDELSATLEEMEILLKKLLLPRDPKDDKNIVLEIRAATGGDEASIFVGDVARMYSKYAENHGMRMEILSSHPTGVGGFKEMILAISGDKIYSKMKYESGVHRVQRVPATETQGRIHTSTITVAVMAEADDVELKIDPNDIKWDVYRSSGPGGQSVNTTDSAVRLTYIPTGMVVTCQDEKSQHKNKAKAMRILRARVLEALQAEQDGEISEQRRSQVGTGERSEKIRTYNYPQGRVTDHRIGLTLYKLEQIMEGDILGIVDALTTFYQTEALKKVA